MELIITHIMIQQPGEHKVTPAIVLKNVCNETLIIYSK